MGRKQPNPDPPKNATKPPPPPSPPMKKNKEIIKAVKYIESMLNTLLIDIKVKCKGIEEISLFYAIENKLRIFCKNYIKSNPTSQVVTQIYRFVNVIKSEIERYRPDLKERSRRF